MLVRWGLQGNNMHEHKGSILPLPLISKRIINKHQKMKNQQVDERV